MQARRLFLAMFAAMAVFVVYQLIIARFLPPPRPAATPQPPATQAVPMPEAESAPSGAAQIPSWTAGALHFTSGAEDELIILGGGEGDTLELELAPRGAAIATIRLCERKDEHYRFRQSTEGDVPYTVLQPVVDDAGPQFSFATRRIWLGDEKQALALADVVWGVAGEPDPRGRRVSFVTALRNADESPLLKLTKTYELLPEPLMLRIDLGVENVSGEPLTVALEEGGPLGIRQENPQYDMRRLATARWTSDGMRLDKPLQRSDLVKAAQHGEPRLLGSGSGEEPFVWLALVNKFFGVFERPLPATGVAPQYVQAVSATAAAPDLPDNPGDLLARVRTTPQTLAPGGQSEFHFEIYAGPKDSKILARSNPAFADSKRLAYDLVQNADVRCVCTFQPLPRVMAWLLHTIHAVVRNYGIAIIVMVVVIRGLLHPLTVFQQKSMFRMQDAMTRLQPLLQKAREKFPNDKVRQNQEMMRIYAEENVNPAASIVGMLPLFIQMPILVALWTALNTDVHLRHAPFDGWWIEDLSAPDALVTFAGDGLTIPVLGWLPLIGRVFTNIHSLNLLPLLMAVSMWLQQRYMPKPGHHAKPGEAKPAGTTPAKPGAMTPEQQLRQQQMIGYMMCVLFPLMFYNMPAGLNLYWMSTNIFGIGETLIIRRQLKAEKERRDRGELPPPKSRKTGFIGQLLRRLADQAEQLQKKADRMSDRPR